MIHEVRVIFGDTDQMGVVYYANYLRYFESARAGYWRASGRSYKDLEAWGVAMPVVEAHARYRKPAFYEDLLAIEVEVTELRAASVRFGYLVRRDGELLASGFTRHAIIDTAGELAGRPRRLPDELRAAITVVPLALP
jgi:acyl-CoA thioester hydrolase